MELWTLLLDHFGTLIALACGFALFYGAAVLFESNFASRIQPEEPHVNFFGD